MDTQQAKQSMDVYTLIAWAAENKKRLQVIGIAVAVVAVAVSVYFWHLNYETTSSEAALDQLPVPSPEDAPRMDPAKYLAVANDYPSTSAAARALLMAGTIQYAGGKYEQAQSTFQQYLGQHHDYPMLTQALIGLAASLEMQGKTNDAVARYEEVMRHSTDPNTIPASAALGRLYAAQGKTEQALNSLARVVQETQQGSTLNAEARLEAQDLLARHPELQQKMMQQQQQQGASSLVPSTTAPPAGQ